MLRKVKQTFFGWLKCSEKCCFCSDEGKTMNSVPVQASAQFCADYKKCCRAGIIQGDNVAGSA